MQMFDNFTLFLIYWSYLSYNKLFFFGILNGAFLLSYNAEDESKAKIFYAIVGVLSVLPLVSRLMLPFLGDLIGINVKPIPDFAWYWLALAIVSWALAFWWLRTGVQKFEKVAKKLTKVSSLERNKKTDIRYIDKFLPQERERFDPLKHIDYSRGYFIGLSEQSDPIYLKKGDWDTSHLLLSGRTRSGKGVAAQIIGTQSIQKKELFVVLDPKVDNWMPHIYKKACEEAGQPYVLLDLRQSAHPQINVLQDCDYETAENMLLAVFGLGSKGDNADAYRAIDRKAARQVAKYLVDNPNVTPREVLAVFGEDWTTAEGESKLTATVFAEMFGEMAELPSVNRKHGGIDLQNLVETGGCLYVIGDMLNTRIIAMQRMILIRLLMIAKNREQTDDMKIIRVFADEFRVHISRPFVVALGAAAGWKLLCVLGFQSFEDLRDVPGDLDADMVKGAVLENCAIQLSYRIKDAATAEILAAATGTILVDDETRSIEKNIVLTETMEGERRVSQSERYLVDVNMITSLPVPDPDKKTIGCGVLVGASKTAQFCFTSPIMVERSKAAITPTTPPPDAGDANEPPETAADRVAALELLDGPGTRPGMVLDPSDGRWKRLPKVRLKVDPEFETVD